MCRLQTGRAGVTTFTATSCQSKPRLRKRLLCCIYTDDKTASHAAIKPSANVTAEENKHRRDRSGLHVKTCRFGLSGGEMLRLLSQKSYSRFPRSSCGERHCLFGFVFSKGNMFLLCIYPRWCTYSTGALLVGTWVAAAQHKSQFHALLRSS